MGFATNPSRLGQVNGTGDDRALFLKVWANEILTGFNNTTVMNGRHTVRTISSGKSAQFPVTGTATAKYHVPGQSIADAANGYLSNIKAAERIINIDDLLVAATFIADIDELMNHYDVRSEYSNQLGTTLGLTYDKNVIRKFIQAARASTPIFTGAKTGTVLKAGATVATTASVLAKSIYDAGVALDEKNVPQDGRFALVSPSKYAMLAQSTDLINSLWGGAGSYSDGKIIRINGIELVKTNQLPNTNEGTTQADGDKNAYSDDYSDTVAIVAHPSAAGTVKLLDLALESEYKIELQGTLSVAKLAVGHGVLRPECAVEISKAAAS